MKNSPVIIGISLVLILGAIGVYAMSMQEKTAMAPAGESMETTNDSMMTASNSPTGDAMMDKTTDQSDSMESETMMQKGQYVPFTPTALAQTASGRRVLFFYANWCPTCAPANDSLQENQARLPSDVTVIRVNYNDTETDQAEKDLAKKYGVTYQHTFVQIDAAGNEVTKWNGGDIDELLNNIQ